MGKIGRKGFTLVELLVTILIISIVFGLGSYVFNNVINNSKNETIAITKDNIKKSANTYAKEYFKEISWLGNNGCVSLEELVSKGYLKKEILNETTIKNIVITKDNNNNILSEKEDTTNTICKNIKDRKVTPPKSSEICNDLTYNGTAQYLINNETFPNYLLDPNLTGIDAGIYKIPLSLNNTPDTTEPLVWDDNTKEDKEITCTIKKKPIDITLDPSRQLPSELGEKEITVTTDAEGTIELKISSDSYVKAEIITPLTGTKEEGYTGKIKVINDTLRETNSYITIIVTPTDENNYIKNSTIYTIGKIDKNKIPYPKPEEFCKKGVYYLGSPVVLIDENKYKPQPDGQPDLQFVNDNGYYFSVYTGFQRGLNQMVATLSDGNKWRDGKTEPYTFNCTALSKFKIHYNGNGNTSHSYNLTDGSVVENNIFKHNQVNSPNTNITLQANKFQKTGYTFDGWTGTGYDKTKPLNLSKEQVLNLSAPDGIYGILTLTANWSINKYTISFNCNGGSGSTASITQKYNTQTTLPANGCTRTGYTFKGWAEESGGAVKYQNKASITIPAKHLTLHAVWQAHTYTVNYYGNGSTGQTYTSSSSCNDEGKCGLNRYAAGSSYDSTNKIFKHASTKTYGKSFDLTYNRFSRDHYNFAGWATSSDGSVKYDNQESVKNLTSTDKGVVKLYAKWTKKNYTISFSCNGGSGSTSSITRAYNTTDNLPGEKCSRSGYTFIGWAKSSGGSVVYKNKASVTFKESFKLYAKWDDQTKPTCKTSKSNTYSTGGVTVKVTCSDAGSGCKSGAGTFTGVKSSKTYAVYDGAGNKGTCSVTVSSRKMYRKRTRTYNSCKTGSKYYKGTCKYTHASSSGKTSKTTTVSGSTAAKCKSLCTQLYGSGAVILGGKCTYYNTCKGGYSSWSSWSSYKHTSCSETTTTDCESRTEYY